MALFKTPPNFDITYGVEPEEGDGRDEVDEGGVVVARPVHGADDGQAHPEVVLLRRQHREYRGSE